MKRGLQRRSALFGQVPLYRLDGLFGTIACPMAFAVSVLCVLSGLLLVPISAPNYVFYEAYLL